MLALSVVNEATHSEDLIGCLTNGYRSKEACVPTGLRSCILKKTTFLEPSSSGVTCKVDLSRVFASA